MALSLRNVGDSPDVNQSVEYFWVSAPNMHMANVAVSVQHAAANFSMPGSSQIGPCSGKWKIQGLVGSPRSAGFSKAN